MLRDCVQFHVHFQASGSTWELIIVNLQEHNHNNFQSSMEGGWDWEYYLETIP
jgi:hypothetical protein